MSTLAQCQGVKPHAHTLGTPTLVTTVCQSRCQIFALTLAVPQIYLVRLPVAKPWLCPGVHGGSSIGIEAHNLGSEYWLHLR